MADSNAGAGGLRYDDIAARVNPDPTAGTPTLLAGYVGKGAAEGRVRIYPDLSFGSYYDVAEADVVHSVPLPVESSPHGGSYVWVKPGANVQQGPVAGASANLLAAALPRTQARLDCTIACGVTQIGQTCPNGDCTFFGTCPHVCGHTRAGFTCGPRDCTIACDAAQAFRQPQNFAQAATPPFSLQLTCGIACTIAPTVCQPPCPPPCTVATTLCPTVNDQTCQPPCPPPPCTVASTLCPTVNDQTCPAPCPPATAMCTPNCTLPSVTCPITPVTRTGVFNPLG